MFASAIAQATNPATALSAAQKFVTQDHVDAVIAVSSLTFAAAPYLTAHKVPVIGAGEDGPEWTKATNMFSVFGALNTTKVTDTLGKFYKMQGVTTVGAVGYSIARSATTIEIRTAQESAEKPAMTICTAMRASISTPASVSKSASCKVSLGNSTNSRSQLRENFIY